MRVVIDSKKGPLGIECSEISITDDYLIAIGEINVKKIKHDIVLYIEEDLAIETPRKTPKEEKILIPPAPLLRARKPAPVAVEEPEDPVRVSIYLDGSVEDTLFLDVLPSMLETPEGDSSISEPLVRAILSIPSFREANINNYIVKMRRDNDDFFITMKEKDRGLANSKINMNGLQDVFAAPQKVEIK